jgi:hypothetical protein
MQHAKKAESVHCSAATSRSPGRNEYLEEYFVITGWWRTKSLASFSSIPRTPIPPLVIKGEVFLHGGGSLKMLVPLHTNNPALNQIIGVPPRILRCCAKSCAVVIGWVEVSAAQPVLSSHSSSAASSSPSTSQPLREPRALK